MVLPAEHKTSGMQLGEVNELTRTVTVSLTILARMMSIRGA